ncbi:hypothetical protein [Salinicola tamaricis]|uniref:hypothetical protein n=1 Tax=Salinicola tamaricis TaxID=1771309 RepID=UPI00101AD5F5|nr:hypothetical protein [Salinicola tamaricis]
MRYAKGGIEDAALGVSVSLCLCGAVSVFAASESTSGARVDAEQRPMRATLRYRIALAGGRERPALRMSSTIRSLP